MRLSSVVFFVMAVTMNFTLCCEEIDQRPRIASWPEPKCAARPHRNKSAPDELDRRIEAHRQWVKSISKYESDINTMVDSRVLMVCYPYFQRAHLEQFDLRFAFLQSATFVFTDLRGTDFSYAKLRNASFWGGDLRGIILEGADLSDANFFGASDKLRPNESANVGDHPIDLSGIRFVGTVLKNAKFSGADLTRAHFYNANLEGAKFHRVDLQGAEFAVASPSALPANIETAQNLHTIRIYQGTSTISAFQTLREKFKKDGLRDAERAITAALQRSYVSRVPWPERAFRLVAFDWTSEYGYSPGRTLRILGALILAFAGPYWFVLMRTESSTSGAIWRIWQPDRILNRQRHDQERISGLGWLRALMTAFYFSVLSAAHIGWRDLNVGSWISRMQPREYTLRATGWVRAVSGVQSLLSVYLLALWVLTYFGRPFE